MRPRSSAAGSTPAASALRRRRLAELKADLAIKHRELRALQDEGVTLAGEEADACAASAEGTPSDAAAGRDPLVEALVRDRTHADTLPIEHMGTATMRLQTAAKDDEAANTVLRKSVHELQTQLAAADKATTALSKEIDVIVDQTGFQDDPMTQYQRSQEQLRADADAGVTVEALEEQLARARREQHAAGVLKAKQEAMVQRMSDTLDSKREVALEVRSAINEMLTAERDVRERKLMLRKALEHHAALDSQLREAALEHDHQTKAVLARDAKYVTDMASGVQAEKRQRQALQKAQQFRLWQLEERGATLNAAMERARVKGEVDAIVEAALRAAEAEANETGEGLPLPDNIAASLSGSRRGTSGGIAAPPRSGSFASPLPTEDDLAPYLDAGAVVPENEVIPAAVHALFLLDLEKQRRTARRQEIMLLEKSEARDAIGDKVAEMVREYEKGDAQLYQQKVRQHQELQQSIADARATMEALRGEYRGVLGDNTGLNRRMRNLREFGLGGREALAARLGVPVVELPGRGSQSGSPKHQKTGVGKAAGGSSGAGGGGAGGVESAPGSEGGSPANARSGTAQGRTAEGCPEGSGVGASHATDDVSRLGGIASGGPGAQRPLSIDPSGLTEDAASVPRGPSAAAADVEEPLVGDDPEPVDPAIACAAEAAAAEGLHRFSSSRDRAAAANSPTARDDVASGW